MAFTRNTKPKIGARFKIASASNLGAIKIKATGPDGVAIPQTAATVFDDEVTLPLTKASSALVNSIKFYDKKDEKKAFKLDWEVKIESSGWSKMATTRHTVYVTLDDPKTSLRQETLFYLGCKNADGQTTESGTTEKIWSEFTDRDVKTVEGKELYYYKTYTGGALSTEELLGGNNNGECSSWVKLFIDIRKVQGMDDHQYILFESILGQYHEGFIVKNWIFNGNGTSGISGYPYFNIPPTSSNPVGVNSYV